MYGGTGAGNSCKKCPTCPESYPNSAGGNIGQSMCYKTCEDIDITGGTNVPTSGTAYYPASCLVKRINAELYFVSRDPMRVCFWEKLEYFVFVKMFVFVKEKFLL